MNAPMAGTQEWLAQVVEEVVEPDLPIVDSHHHLWPDGGPLPYGLAELHDDTGSGHRIEQSVFIECGAAYHTDGPPDLAPVGETEFVAGVARRDPTRLISAIVAHVDLRSSRVEYLLDAHDEAGDGLLRGVRDAIARAEDPEGLMIPGSAPGGLSLDQDFRAGMRALGRRGLTYDSWHYHFQHHEFIDLARAIPDTTMVLDHFGTPLGVGRYTSEREAIFEQWKLDMTELARCENVVVKLGGLAMPDNGFGWNLAPRPPSSDEFVAAQGRYYLHAIEAFGPERCMFESNFPVDRFSLSYRVLWNAFKKLTTGFSTSERTAMFSGTARRVYQLRAHAEPA